MSKIVLFYMMMVSFTAYSSTGVPACDRVVQQNAALAIGLDLSSISVIQIPSSRVVRTSGDGFKVIYSLSVNFVEPGLGVAGTAKLSYFNETGVCRLKSLTVSDVQW